MCSISGVLDFNNEVDSTKAEAMSMVMARRGPDSSGVFAEPNAVLCHNRLAVIDPEFGQQPMTVRMGERTYTIVYNGEIYNCDELREKLQAQGIKFRTRCDTEVVLYSYIVFGEQCPNLLNGIFAFCVFDSQKRRAFFARDPFGVKPLFYTQRDSAFYFASEVKGLLAHPDIPAQVDQTGLWQLFYMTPVTINGSGVFHNIYELEPGQCAVVDKTGITIRTYWKLEAREHTLSREDTIAEVRSLLIDSVTRQLGSDVPLCTFLSGGLDSSVVSAIAKGAKEDLCTYSFEYEGNKESFASTLFQPQRDDEYATYCADWLNTDHTILTAPTAEVAGRLIDATLARDLPGQADIDSSLLYFCSQVKKYHTVALSGECADEIFGGYPWFYRKEMVERDFFPWVHDPFVRISLFDEAIARKEEGYEYVKQVYRDTLAACPTLPSDSESMRTSRLAGWLSQRFFMTSLLERKDRMSMYSSLEVRVPFADRRILDCVYNVPWELKFENGVEKSLLRNAAEGLLPERILHRKKSPYPKTHNPAYQAAVTQMLEDRLARPDSMLSRILKKGLLDQLIQQENATWFGQLMATPQLIAWLVQLDCWFSHYHIDIV